MTETLHNQRVELAVFVVALVAVVLFVATLARRVGTSAPLLLTVVGIGLGYLPGVPLIEVDREIVLLGLLPPLLYAAAIRTAVPEPSNRAVTSGVAAPIAASRISIRPATGPFDRPPGRSKPAA